MKTVFQLFLYALCFVSSASFAQNSSNKGTDFWIGFPAHGDGNKADMYLYITGDSNTTGTVSIPGQSWSTNFSVTANNMTLVSIPSTTAYVGCTDCIEKRGIYVVSAKKIVVYAHIYYQYRSDATLVLPTPATGKEYYAMAWEQHAGTTSDRSQFMIVANKDNTKINITPAVDLGKASGGSWPKNQTYQITLDRGEVYQGRAKNYALTDDVTGTKIEVIDTGSAAKCNTIAVFSGSSNCFIGCNPNGGVASRDNLYQQLYPTRSWGNKYVTVPFKGRTADNLTIVAREDNTTVLIYHASGTPSNFTLKAGQDTSFLDVTTTKVIIGSKPICVAQYQESQKCGGKGDPSMTILSPIEQTLKQISVYSSQYEAISDHYINVVIHNSGVNSFRIDGVSASFNTVPKLPSYSYAQIVVTKGVHKMSSDVGFNAIAYGFGNYESYGYAAGANVKDLTSKMELTNSSQQDVNSICLGQSAEFEGQAEYKVSKWEWDLGDGTTKTGQYISHVYKNTGRYTVTLKTHKLSFDGCSTYDSSDQDIAVYNRPKAAFTTSLRCEKNTISFTDSSKSLDGEELVTSYWIFGAATPIYAPSTTKYFDTSGVFPMKLITVTEFQCADTAFVDLVINPNPKPKITAPDVCFKDSLKFTNASTVTKGTIAVNKWYFGDGDSSTKYHPTHFYKNTGTYAVTLIATTDSSCVGTVNDTVYKYPSFTMNFKSVDTCAGMALSFINTSTTTADTIKNYRWKFPSTTYNTKNAQHTFATPGSYKVKLLGTLLNFCTDSIEKTIIVDPKVAASFNVVGGCMNDTVRFTSTSTLASGTFANIAWDLDNSIFKSGAAVKHKYTTSGTKNIKMIALSDKGCADTATKTISVRNALITGIVKPLSCAGKTTKIYATYTLDTDSIKTYNWTVSNGMSGTKDTLSFSTIIPGKYYITLTATTKYGCTIKRSDSIVVNAVPQPGFTVSDGCEGFSLKPVNTTTISSVEAINYVWYFNGSQTSTVKNPTIVATPAGSATLRMVATSAAGCVDEITKSINIYSVPKAGFNYIDTCLGMTTTFSDNSNISSGSISSYSWRFNDGTLDNGSIITRTYSADGSYSLKHVVTSDKGCSDSITRNFNIAPKPQISVTPDKLTGCEPLLVNTANTSTINSGTITSYSWDWGDGTTGVGITPSKIYDDAGNYIITVYATSNANCKDTLVVAGSIDVLEAPIADFTYSPLEPSLLFPDVDFTSTSSPDATSFMWNIGDGTTASTPNVSHKYADAGSYNVILIVTADNGCKDTTAQIVKLKLDFFIWIPTVFSPNGDNTNDVFRVHGTIPDMKGFSMEIFNRWGEVVFKTDNPMLTWDATYNDKPVPAGSYGYAVRYINYETGRWESKKGAIAIIR